MKSAALALAAVAACSGAVPVGSIACRGDSECPTGAYCTAGGKCDLVPSVLASPSPTASLDASRTAITLSWPRVPGAVSYDIQRGTSPGGEAFYANAADLGGAGPASWGDPAPDSGRTDYYKVVAKGATSSSAPSAEVSALTVPAAPATVSAAVGGVSVTVTWTASAGATGYRVLRDGTDVSGILDSAQLAYTDSTVSAGATYRYAVTAVNASGNGLASVPQQSVTLQPLAPVLSVAQLSNSGTTTTIKLAWTRPAGATSYQLFKGNTAAEETLFQTFADPAAGYTDVETATAQTVHFRVVATNAAPAGSASNDVSATTVPAAPTGVLATFGGGGIDVSWAAAPTAGSYTVSRSDGSSTILVGTVQAPSLALLDSTNLQPSTLYTYTVAAKDSTGALLSVASAPATATTPVPMPANVTAAPIDDTHVQVSWDFAPAGVEAYDVFRGATAGGEDTITPVNPTQIANVNSGGRVTFTDATAVANTRYFYKVIAYHNSAPAQSSAISASEGSALTYYPAPSGLFVKATNDNGVTVGFAPPAGGPYTYDLLRGLAVDQYDVAASCVGAGTNPESCAEAGTLVQNATYHYRVRVHDPASGNVSLPSNDVQAVTTNTSAPSISATAPSPTSVSLSIPRFTGYDIYDVYESPTSTPPTSSQAPTLFITSTSGDEFGNVTATRTVAAGTWFYWARARWSGSALSVTPWSSSPAQVTTNLALTAPTGLNVQGIGANLVSLLWNPVAGATSYSITRSGAAPVSTTNPYFTDTNAAPNTSYSYTVATNGNASLSASVGPLTTLTDANTTFTCSVPALLNYYSDGPTVQQPSFAANKVVAGASILNVKNFADGRCLATGLPATGPVFVRRGQNYFLTSGRSMDLSTELYGRVTSGFYGAMTPATFNVTGLSPWTSTDQVELFGSNNSIFAFGLQGQALAGAPGPGDTALNGLTVDLANTGMSEVDTAFADKPILVDMATLNSSLGIPYRVVAKTLPITTLSSVDGRPVTVSGAFNDVLGSAVSKPFKYLRSQFKALSPLIGPGATGDVDDVITLQASPRDGSAVPTPHAFTGGSADLLAIPFPRGSTADVDVGNILVTSPYPASWFTFMDVALGFAVPIGCGTGNTPINVGAGDAIIDDATSMLQKAATGIGPVLPPVASPKISANGVSFADAFQPQTGMGLTPTLQWVVQSSLPVPNYIRIFILQIGVDTVNHACKFVDPTGHLTTTQFQIAQVFLPYQASQPMTVTLPAGILVAGNSYVAIIRSTYEPGRDVVNRPMMRGSAEYFVEVVTNTFSP